MTTPPRPPCRHLPNLDDDGEPYCMRCLKHGYIVFDDPPPAPPRGPQ